jgi:hypothetical protein
LIKPLAAWLTGLKQTGDRPAHRGHLPPLVGRLDRVPAARDLGPRPVHLDGRGEVRGDLLGQVDQFLGPAPRIAESLPLASVLAEELSLFRVAVTLSANETFEAWRERDHDDLVLALALALYVGSFPPMA